MKNRDLRPFQGDNEKTAKTHWAGCYSIGIIVNVEALVQHNSDQNHDYTLTFII